MSGTEEPREGLARAIIESVPLWLDLPPVIGEPKWGFLYVDITGDGIGNTDVELSEDEILVTKHFAVTRNGLPVALMVMQEDGSFIMKEITSAVWVDPSDPNQQGNAR